MYVYVYIYDVYIYMFMVMIYRSFSGANVHYRVHNKSSYWKVCLYVVQYTNSYGKIDRYDRYIYIYILYRKSLQIWYTQLVGHGCEHEAPQSSGRRSSSFQLLSALLNVWQVIFTKVKCLLSLAHCMWLKPRKYIGTQPK